MGIKNNTCEGQGEGLKIGGNMGKFLMSQGFFFAIFGRGYRAFQIGKISSVNH